MILITDSVADFTLKLKVGTTDYTSSLIDFSGFSCDLDYRNLATRPTPSWGELKLPVSMFNTMKTAMDTNATIELKLETTISSIVRSIFFRKASVDSIVKSELFITCSLIDSFVKYNSQDFAPFNYGSGTSLAGEEFKYAIGSYVEFYNPVYHTSDSSYNASFDWSVVVGEPTTVFFLVIANSPQDGGVPISGFTYSGDKVKAYISSQVNQPFFALTTTYGNDFYDGAFAPSFAKKLQYVTTVNGIGEIYGWREAECGYITSSVGTKLEIYDEFHQLNAAYYNTNYNNEMISVYYIKPTSTYTYTDASNAGYKNSFSISDSDIITKSFVYSASQYPQKSFKVRKPKFFNARGERLSKIPTYAGATTERKALYEAGGTYHSYGSQIIDIVGKFDDYDHLISNIDFFTNFKNGVEMTVKIPLQKALSNPATNIYEPATVTDRFVYDSDNYLIVGSRITRENGVWINELKGIAA